jgi:RNA polymerase sigma-70 factor, ECF subfamily
VRKEIAGNAWGAMGTRDADEMGRWLRGDGAAFEALVGRWQGPVARFLFRYTGRADLVPDLCQEAFLRVYQAGPRYREGGAFPAWLFRIALNVARDARRRRRRDPVPLNGAEPVDPTAPAEALCRRRELAAWMARAAAELPEALRVVLALRHDEGLSFEEIARLTGAPASTVKSRFAAALGRLRVRLEQLGYGPEEITP